MVLQDVTAKHCQTKARECARLAGIAGSVAVSDMYRKMELRWLEVAVKAEAEDLAIRASYAPAK